MSFLNISEDLQGGPTELETVPGGEYELIITYADIPAGARYAIVRLGIADFPLSKDVSLFLNLPGSGRTEKEEILNRGFRKSFYNAFGLEETGSYNVNEPEPEGLINRRGWAFLSDPFDDGKGYGMQNRVSKFITKK